MTIGIAGHATSIAQELIKALPPGAKTECGRLSDLPLDLNHYLICCGYLAGKRIDQIKEHEADRTWHANFLEPARFLETLFARNDKARVVIIGSESGYRGSFDMAYAGAKAALHLYVETKRLRTPEQLLVAIAPCIISDSGMTQRRKDLAQTEARGAATRHGRWLKAAEVAALALEVLSSGTPFLSNTVIRLRGEVP